MLQDLTYAWRALRHRWRPALTAVVCLTLGIGVNATLFGVLDALLFRPPAAVSAPAELLRVRLGAAGVAQRLGAGPSVTYPQVQAISEQLGGVADVATYAPRMMTLGSGEGAEPIAAVIASANYFAVLGVAPHGGRFPRPGEDDVRGAAAVGVLSHASWKRRFDSAPAAIGSTLEVNGEAVVIIGIAPPGFTGVDLGEPELWLNDGAAGVPAFGGPSQFTDRTYWLQVIARRRPGVADAALAYALDGGDPLTSGGVRIGLHALPLRAMFFAEHRGQNPVPVWTIGITLAVLLLACATVANLLLAQGAAREQEMAVRLSLGAPRHRVLRQLLLENLLIALGAAIGALVLAAWSARLVQVLPIPAIPRLIDVRVAVFTFAVALLATLLFGVLPAVWTTRSDPHALLRRGAAAGSRHRAGLQHALMSTQIAFSFVLLVSGGLFLASFRNVLRVDTGFELDHVVEVGMDFSGRGFSTAETYQLIERATERAAAVPGVSAAAAASVTPFYFFNRSGFIIADGRSEDDQPVSEFVSVVGADYIAAMGARMHAGRTFEPSDVRTGERAAIVSRAMERRYWPGGSALGACIRLRTNDERCVRVVGVTDELRLQDLRGETTAILFLVDSPDDRPAAIRRATIFVNARDPRNMVEPLRRAIRSLHADMPFVSVAPLDDRVRPSRIPWEVAATLFTTLGLLATLLAALGLHMVVTFMVRQRSRELGIRSALGSSKRALFTLVVGRAVRVSAVGLGAGGVAALVVTRLLARRLHNVAATDPMVWASAAGLLLVVTLAASWLPGRTAAALDPLVVMRQE